MNRRGFLAAVPIAVLAQSGSQQARPDTTRRAADPLRDPTWAGTRRAEVRPADNDATVKAIEKRLRCNCNCGLDVYVCRTTDFSCTYSPALHRELVDLLATGRTPDQAVDDFVAKYGETILMAPKPQGFGLVGYVLPSIAILAAGSLLTWVLVRRNRARAVLVEPARGSDALAEPPTPVDVAPDERARLERTLREMDA